MAGKYHHEEFYRGENFRDKLTGAVAICGVGALGSNLADMLARIGFPFLILIDKDRVEEQNISTQVWKMADIGTKKAETLKNKLFLTTNDMPEAFDKELDEGNIKKALRSASLVVDCFDNSASRKLVQDHCRDKKIPCLHVGLFEDYGEIIWDAKYRVPKDADGDACDYALSRTIIMLAATVAAEEILDHFLADKPREASWSITLRDLAIRRK